MYRPTAVQFLKPKFEKSLDNIQSLLDKAKVLISADSSIEVQLKELTFGYLDRANEWIFKSRMSDEEEEEYKKKVKKELEARQKKRKKKQQNSQNRPPLLPIVLIL